MVPLAENLIAGVGSNSREMPRCRIPNCTVGNAFFNFPDVKGGVLCSKHKEPGMVDKYKKECKEDGCEKRPSYGNIGDEKPSYCAKHAKPGMIDIAHKCCIAEGCLARAHYNEPGKKTPIYCSAHKPKEMVATYKQTCLFDGCDKTRLFNFEDEEKPMWCGDHKQPGMVDLAHDKCAQEGCKTRPSFNMPGQKGGKWCFEHKPNDAVIMHAKICIEEGCTTSATCNFPGVSPVIYCSSHKKPGMIIINAIYCHCGVMASYGFPGDKQKTCVKHKEDGMINVVSPRCKNDGCDMICQSKYGGYCARCFIFLFPDNNVARYYKVKEKHVLDFLVTEFPDQKIINDRKIVGGCSTRRPDFLIDMLTHSVVIEVDENQHSSNRYLCESKRMMEIFQDLGPRPMVYIRFNPDKYVNKKGKTIESCFKQHTVNDMPVIATRKAWQGRLKTLKKHVSDAITSIPEKELTLITLFYDQK